MEKLGEAGEDDRTVKAASFHARGTFPVKGFRSGSCPRSLCLVSQDNTAHITALELSGASPYSPFHRT